MRRIIFAMACAAILGLAAQPVQASEFEDMDIGLGKAVVARALCKDPLEVNYVTRLRENMYLFSVFYAKQEARFVVAVSEKFIRIQGREYLKLTKTIPYTFDSDAKCSIVDFTVPGCPNTDRIVVCSEKTVEEKLDDKFWGKSIPELLDEDLRRALEAYEQGDAPAEEGQEEETPEQ